jgi:hypothetical protein
VGTPGGLQALTEAGGAAIGLVLAALGLALAARAAKGEASRDRLDRLCCSLILFSLTAAAMAAVGRAYASPTMQIPVRYSVLMAPLHIGVLTLLAIRWPAVARLGSGRLAAVLACVFVVALGQQVVGRRLVLGYCARIREAVAAFDAGRRTPDMTQYVYPKLGHAEAITAEMKRRDLYQ